MRILALPNLSNYTIQSDLYGTKLKTDLPDMGVGANRYTLMLLGNTQELRVGDWDAQPLRAETNMAFKWEARRLVSHEADRHGEGRQGLCARQSLAARSRRSRRSGR